MSDAVIGRDDELESLKTFVASAADGPAALLIEGEAGIGKTTLWRAVTKLARKREYLTLASTASAAETQLAFATAHDLLEPVFEEAVQPLPVVQRHALGAALLIGEEESAAPEPRLVAVAFLEALRALARERPLAVAVDDIQWLDPSSALLLEFALRRLDDPEILFLLSRRGFRDERLPLGLDRIPEANFERLFVGPLTVGALHRLLRLRFGGSFPRPLLRRLHETSAGNPFYALELARALREPDARIEPGAPLPTPGSLRDLLTERLARLPRTVQEALATAAALSSPTVFVVDADEALDAGMEAGIVQFDGDRVRFTHPLLAAESYALMGAEQRRRIHRRLAARVSDPEEHARHLALSADAPSEKIARALDRAARRAARRGARTEAAELSGLAARLTPPGSPNRVERRLQMVDYELQTQDFANARQELEELLEGLEPGALRAKILMRLARIVEDDDVDAAIELGYQALAEPGVDDETSALAHEGLALLRATCGDLHGAREEAREALAHAERAGSQVLVGQMLAAIGQYSMLMGEPLRDSYWERARALEASAPDVSFTFGPSAMDAMRLLYADRLDESRAALTEAHGRAEALGDEETLEKIEFYFLALELRAGRLEEAARYADSLYQLVGQGRNASIQAQVLTARARIAAYVGRVEGARSAAEEALLIADEAGEPRLQIPARSVLGFIELSRGDARAAAEYLRPLWDELVSIGYGEPSAIPVLPDSIQALIESGDLDEATRQLNQLEERGKALDSAWALSQAARCRGLLVAAEGDPAAALHHFEEALRQHERMPGPFERGRTLLALGQVQRRLKRRRVARESLEAALAIFEELGTPLWAEKARAGLARVGGRAPARTRALTETERRTAELAADGKSNKEIAAELYVTVRTVESNLTKVYEKLGVHRRTELAHRLRIVE
jgi:DNA-binding CsgD family transcriptional regulator